MNTPRRPFAATVVLALSAILLSSCSDDPAPDPSASPTVVGSIGINTQGPDDSPTPAAPLSPSPTPTATAGSVTPGTGEDELPHELFETTFSQEHIDGVCKNVTSWFASAGNSSLDNWKDRGVSSRYVTSFYLQSYDDVAYSALQEGEWGERDYEVLAEPLPSTGTAFCAIYRPSFRGDYEAVFFTYSLVDEESGALDPALMRYEQSVTVEQLRAEATRSLTR